MSITNLKDKIEKIEKLYNFNKQLQSYCSQDQPKVPVKNVEVLITDMIKQQYEWEEITAVVGMLRKGKGEDLIKIIRDTIS